MHIDSLKKNTMMKDLIETWLNLVRLFKNNNNNNNFYTDKICKNSIPKIHLEDRGQRSYERGWTGVGHPLQRFFGTRDIKEA